MKKYIIPLLIGISILAIGITFWIFKFYIPFIKQGCFETAGQFGDSFGFFNFIALIILSITMIIQIVEFRLNREEQEKTNKISKNYFELQIEFNYNNDIHKNNFEELKYYKDLYQKYYTMFIEQYLSEPTGGVHTLDSELILAMIQRLFYQPFHKFQYVIKKQFDRDFLPPTKRERLAEEPLDKYGIEIFNIIDEKLNEIDKILTDEFEKYLMDVKKRITI